MDSKGAMVIIAGSGMCTGGRIVHHLVDGLPDANCIVVFVGYQAEGTPGKRIQAAAHSKGTVWFQHQDIPVRCKIETLHGLSAHMDRDELLDWVGHIPNVKRIGLHHGDSEAQHALVEHAHTLGIA